MSNESGQSVKKKTMKLKEICRSLSQKVKGPTATPLREAMATSRRDLRLLYEVDDRLLGKGGFGEVHAATRRCDGLRVAVKEVRRSTVPPSMLEEGLPLEVRLLQAVEDVPGVIRLLDYFATPESFFIVMELVEGRDLFDYISERGPLEERLAARLFKQVVESVAGCQERGVLHGDVKDENVLVEEDSNGEVRARLIDLGSGSWFSSSEVYSNYEGTRVYAPQSGSPAGGTRRRPSPFGALASSSMTCSVATSPLRQTPRSWRVVSSGGRSWVCQALPRT